jgi:protein-S-isoprenylcysteine O-methyltransferase Ste14
MIRALLILPGTALVYVPAAILWASWNTGWHPTWPAPDSVELWAGIALAVPAISLMFTSAMEFRRHGGGGTPAPWDPPRRLVVQGPYRYVRNPMLSGVIMFTTVEALVLTSWPLFWWTIVLFAANAIYFPVVEENALERRFGEPYRQYKRHVPRWLPRLTPWSQNSES